VSEFPDNAEALADKIASSFDGFCDERAELHAALSELAALVRTWENIAVERGVRMDEIQERAEVAEAERDRYKDALEQIASSWDTGASPYRLARAALASERVEP
jgi:hypothetical protein